MRKIGIKYCGNCNPQINSPSIVKALRVLTDGQYQLLPWDESGYELLLILSGCPADCATRPLFNGTIISVAGKQVDLRPVAPEDIPEILVERIRAVYQPLE